MGSRVQSTPSMVGAARRRLGQAQQHQRGGGLARAVGAEQAEDLALLHAQFQFIHGGDAAVALGQAPGFDDRPCHAQRLPNLRITAKSTRASTTMAAMPTTPQVVSVFTVTRNSAESEVLLSAAVMVVR